MRERHGHHGIAHRRPRLERAGPLSRSGGRGARSRFAAFKLNNAAVERLFTGARWAEGPVWFGDHGCLLFSDIPNNRILRFDAAGGGVSEFRRPSNNTNGHCRDARVGCCPASTTPAA